MDKETVIERRWDLEKEIERRGRVRDISGQYCRRALTTKILASLNRRSSVTKWVFFFFFFAFFVFMPYICLPDRRKRLRYFSFPFFRFGYEMLLQLSFFFFFFFNGFRFDLYFFLGFRVFCHWIESPIKDKEKRIEIETNHPPSIQSDHRNHRHIKIHLDLLSSL